MRIRRQTNRRGMILPYVAISCIGLCGFIALAIDLGMIMLAKTQTQNAADAAAFAGARTLTGGTSANTSAATTNGQAVANLNTVLGTNIPTANVTMTHGAYHYDSSTQTFSPQYPPVSPDNYNLSKAVITQGNQTYFAQIFQLTTFNVTATAVAAHRPRDTCIVLDFSGSMNNESDLWNCESYQGSYQNTPNNTDSVFPQWGYYDTTFSSLATIQCTSSSDLVGYCNITQTVGGCGPQVNDYYQNARGASGVAAFTNPSTWPAISVTGWTAGSPNNAGFASFTLPSVTLSSTQPAGDWAQTAYRSPPGNLTYGKTISSAQSGRTSGTTILMAGDLIPNNYGNGTSGTPGSNPGPYNGTNLWGSLPVGYTVGPKYWGGTFFTWPPDPNNDWRQLYFLASDGTPWKNSLNTNTSATSTSSANNPSAYPSNSALFASNGLMNSPTGNYQINYKAILSWIRTNMMQQSAGDGRPFPQMLRSSNCTLYSSIPTDIPSTNYTWANGNSSISDPSTRFWKEYIDFVIGVYRDPTGNIQIPGTSTCSYGPMYTAGSSTGGQYVSISGTDATIYINGLVTLNSNGTQSTNTAVAPSSQGSGYSSAPTVTISAPSTTNGVTATATTTISGGKVTGITITNPGSGYTSAPTITISGGGGSGAKLNASQVAYLQTYTFMNPSDNPKRPRHGFWFGPQTMIQYMMDTGILPGVTSDISMLPAKLGIQGALTDVQNNHPNDMVSMLMFSRPHFSGEPTEIGQFTLPVNSLSRDYTSMINSLWFPPNSSSADVTPWTADGLNTPHAHGDYDSNTATSYGLMLAYNQLSSNTTVLPSAGLGGSGRKGAQRLVILETDGMANVATSAPFVSSVTNGTNNSYYNLGGNNASVGGADPSTDAENVATKICALTTDNVNGPGFATATKPVYIHCIAFGALFMPDANGAAGGNTAMAMLQSISATGGTGFPSSVTDTTSQYYYKLCIGTLAQRQSKLQTAFTKIMDDGVAIIMVK